MLFRSLGAGLASLAIAHSGWPGPRDWALFTLAGALVTPAHWLVIRAFQLAEASLVSPLRYLAIVFAALLGYLVFDEVPGPMQITGAAVVVGAAIYVLRREGAEVTAVVKPGTDPSQLLRYAPATTVVAADLGDFESLRSVVREARPEEIYNLGGFTAPGESWDHQKEVQRINVDAVHVLLEAAQGIPAADVRRIPGGACSGTFVPPRALRGERDGPGTKPACFEEDRKSTRLNSSHMSESRMPASA